MSDLITNITRIPPPQEAAAVTGGDPLTVGGFTLALTIFFLGLVFFVILGYYLLIKVFGQPMATAQEAAEKGKCIIQHTETNKGATMKLASVSGGAFQYSNIRDGTVAAIPESVANISGRQLIFTYAQMGITIPPKLLAGISAAIQAGIEDREALKTTYSQQITPYWMAPPDDNPEGESIRHEGTPYLKTDNNSVILSGYNFSNFQELLKQSKEELLIPLSIESVKKFINLNYNATYIEQQLTIDKELNRDEDEPDINSQKLKHFIAITGALAFLILISAVIKV